MKIRGEWFYIIGIQMFTSEIKKRFHMECNRMQADEILDFMAGSAMIFSGFAIRANDMQDKIDNLESAVSNLLSENLIEWTTLSLLSSKTGLTKDALRKRLQNGDFEEGVDFKRDGNKIVVHQGAIGRLQRKRRSFNG